MWSTIREGWAGLDTVTRTSRGSLHRPLVRAVSCHGGASNGVLGSRRGDQRSELVRPRSAAPIGDRPDPAKPAAGAQHARDLRERRLVVEPVKGVGDRHRVDRRVRERDRLGEAVAHALGADPLGQHVAQRGLRLDRQHVQTAGE
jgi:hypothetical protein